MSKGRARGLPKSGMFTLKATQEIADALDAFLDENPGVESRGAAIRVLVMTALEQPRLRVIASETLMSWAKVERHFYGQLAARLVARFRESYEAMFEDFREEYEQLMGDAMKAEGWDADFVAEVARDVRERRHEHQRSRREAKEAAREE